MQLLFAAIKYTPSGGRVRVGTEIESGPDGAARRHGHARRDAARICSRTCTTARSRNPADVPGPDQGLAVAKQILDAHHATVALSDRPGDGTSLHVVFPFAETERPSWSWSACDVPAGPLPPGCSSGGSGPACGSAPGPDASLVRTGRTLPGPRAGSRGRSRRPGASRPTARSSGGRTPSGACRAGPSGSAPAPAAGRWPAPPPDGPTGAAGRGWAASVSTAGAMLCCGSTGSRAPGTESTPVRPARCSLCQRRRPPVIAVIADWISTRYISCRYANCCSGSRHSGRSDSRSNRNATAAVNSCRASMPSQAMTRLAASSQKTRPYTQHDVDDRREHRQRHPEQGQERQARRRPKRPGVAASRSAPRGASTSPAWCRSSTGTAGGRAAPGWPAPRSRPWRAPRRRPASRPGTAPSSRRCPRPASRR